MSNSSLNIDPEKASGSQHIDVIIDVLGSGRSVVLPAEGFSMFPVLRPGDRIRVNPVIKGSLPREGDVLVFLQNGELIVHRLVQITGSIPGEMKFITRGDSMNEPDKPWPRQNLLGVATGYTRGKKEYVLKSALPGLASYKFNRWLLWWLNKFRRVKNLFQEWYSKAG